jgi:hypothetical protein
LRAHKPEPEEVAAAVHRDRRPERVPVHGAPDRRPGLADDGTHVERHLEERPRPVLLQRPLERLGHRRSMSRV